MKKNEKEYVTRKWEDLFDFEFPCIIFFFTSSVDIRFVLTVLVWRDSSEQKLHSNVYRQL